MGSKSVTFGQVKKAVKTCLLILPNDQSYSSLTTLLKYEQRFLFLKKIPANRPFPSSSGPHFQNEGRFSAFDMEINFHSHAFIFTRKVVHLDSFWKWGLLELGSGLLKVQLRETLKNKGNVDNVSRKRKMLEKTW